MFTREEFIQKYGPIAEKITAGTGLFPQTLLAMAIVESSGNVNGKYLVGANASARYANNYFGIKASAGWKGNVIRLNTPKDPTPTSLFRSYDSINDSMKDYVQFLKNNKRYPNAGVFEAQNYAEQIIRIAKAGYADNMSYATLVTNVADRVNSMLEKFAKVIKPLKDNSGTAALLLMLFFFTFINKEKNETIN